MVLPMAESPWRKAVAADFNTNHDTLIRIPDVVKYVGLCKATIYKLIAENHFPSPKKISSRAVGWLHSDIQEWIKSRPSNKSIEGK